MKVEDAVVFVTGANRGIGLAFARQALALGAAKVYAGMRNTDGFGEPGLIPVPIDVTDQPSVERAARKAGDVTILINNAGIAATVANALADEVEELSRRIFEVNYYGVIRVTKAFAPVLGRAPESAVVNVLSSASWGPSPFLTPTPSPSRQPGATPTTCAWPSNRRTRRCSACTWASSTPT